MACEAGDEGGNVAVPGLVQVPVVEPTVTDPDRTTISPSHIA